LSSSRKSSVHESNKIQNSRYEGRTSTSWSPHQEKALLERDRSQTSRPFRQERSLYQDDISLERSRNTSRSFRQEASLERDPFRPEYGSLNGRCEKGEIEEESEDDDHKRVRSQEKNRKRNCDKEEKIRNQEGKKSFILSICFKYNKTINFFSIFEMTKRNSAISNMLFKE
jgi:hypothetical protein